MVLAKIISGGQTGADQGALDGAISRKFPYGGAIPAGRKTEAGSLSGEYIMEELASTCYPVRTEKNVRDGDGTLILSHGNLSGGSALTAALAMKFKKPCLHIDFAAISMDQAVEKVETWLTDCHIRILNVAGPRASSDHRIYGLTRQLIASIVELAREQGSADG